MPGGRGFAFPQRGHRSGSRRSESGSGLRTRRAAAYPRPRSRMCSPLHRWDRGRQPAPLHPHVLSGSRLGTAIPSKEPRSSSATSKRLKGYDPGGCEARSRRVGRRRIVQFEPGTRITIAHALGENRADFAGFEIADVRSPRETDRCAERIRVWTELAIRNLRVSPVIESSAITSLLWVCRVQIRRRRSHIKPVLMGFSQSTRSPSRKVEGTPRPPCTPISHARAG